MPQRGALPLAELLRLLVAQYAVEAFKLAANLAVPAAFQVCVGGILIVIHTASNRALITVV